MPQSPTITDRPIATIKTASPRASPPSLSTHTLPLVPMPPLPALIPDTIDSHDPSDPTIERTNTLALLLPHLSLFSPPVLVLLRQHYEAYGRIAHWAPVKGFGRVIVVFEDEDGAETAKREGDWLRLDVKVPESGEGGESGVGGGVAGNGNTGVASGACKEGLKGVEAGDKEGLNDGLDVIHAHATGLDNAGTGTSDDTSQTLQQRTAPALLDPNVNFEVATGGGQGYFARRKRRKSASPSGGLILRLHRLPPTTLADLTPQHLSVPAHDKNFLISPPGSPPEGWEPIREEGPNTSTLADDLQKALERIQLNGVGSGRHGHGHARRGSKEVILDEGGVRVEVEDTDTGGVDGDDGVDGEGEGDGASATTNATANKDRTDVVWATSFTYDNDIEMGQGEGIHAKAGAGIWRIPSQSGTPGLGTPGGSGGLGGLGGIGGTKTRIIPTARPPM